MNKLVEENGNNKSNDQRIQQTSKGVDAYNGCKKRTLELNAKNKELNEFTVEEIENENCNNEWKGGCYKCHGSPCQLKQERESEYDMKE